jgi:antirestriction protein ArdC
LGCGINPRVGWRDEIPAGSEGISTSWLKPRSLLSQPAKQATELKANVRKGERGSLVVYADKIIRTETDTATGEEAERAIPFMKGYTVFNVEQIDGLPEHYYAKPAPRIDALQRIDRAEGFFAATGATVPHGGTRA